VDDLMIVYQNLYKKGMVNFQIGPNKGLHDYTYTGNLVHAHLLAADQLAVNPGVQGEIFFITDDAPLPFWDFSRKIFPFLIAADPNPQPQRNIPVLPLWLAWWSGLLWEIICWFTGRHPYLSRSTVMYMCVNRWHSVEKAKRVLGYQPQFSTDESVRSTAEVRFSAIL
jgi:sterol-4alpha-carboxylate 3-dehydrogenase (decarboxylating)